MSEVDSATRRSRVRPGVVRPPIPPPPLRVVEPGERSIAAKRRRARLVVLGTVITFAGMVFGLVLMHVMLAQNQLRLDHLNSQAASEQVAYERLRLQVAQLESPARIVKEASNRGMVVPPGVTYLVPQRSQSASSATPPSQTAGTPAASSDWPEVKPELAAGP